MQIKVTHPTKNEAELVIIPTNEELDSIKKHVLGHFKDQVKVAGFRAGKTPIELVEKHADPQALQVRFLDEAVEQLYRKAMQTQGLRPVAAPKVSITKFVPFTTLEFTATVAVLGVIKLADYKKPSTVEKPKVAVTAKDVNGILENLQLRMAEKKDVERVSKTGDQVWIDFSGVDAKDKPVAGADGKDYPLALGSNTFIPGFEDNVTGMKANETKTFTLTFPKDYGVKALAGSKVTFTVIVSKVQEVVKPALDDEFAKKAGPFTTMETLKDDIKKQMTLEREQQVQREYESELIRDITNKSTLDAPSVLVDEQLERMINQDRQNAVYRGQTWEEYLEQQGMTEEEYKTKARPAAEERVKASLVLSEVADAEQVNITRDELDARMEALKTQYQDPKMQAELETDEARQDIASRMLTEKTIVKLVEYAAKKK
jgi:trigger factor